MPQTLIVTIKALIVCRGQMVMRSCHVFVKLDSGVMVATTQMALSFKHQSKHIYRPVQVIAFNKV